MEELDEVLHQDGVVARPAVLGRPGGAGEAAEVRGGGLGGEVARGVGRHQRGGGGSGESGGGAQAAVVARAPGQRLELVEGLLLLLLEVVEVDRSAEW